MKNKFQTKCDNHGILNLDNRELENQLGRGFLVGFRCIHNCDGASLLHNDKAVRTGADLIEVRNVFIKEFINK